MDGRERGSEAIRLAAIACCEQWASQVAEKLGTSGVFLFGSAIHLGGSQFDPSRSDLDLIILMPGSTALSRSTWLDSLRELKHDLELRLLPVFLRTDAGTPIVSVVPVTPFELTCDIHKSGVSDFFRNNVFARLDAPGKAAPLLAGEPAQTHTLTRQICAFAQALRNKFLAVSASGRQAPLLPGSDIEEADPLPKPIMRNAAMAHHVSSASTDMQMAFDLPTGLEHFSAQLYQLRDSDERFRVLANWLSVRRGARGTAPALSDSDYVLMAELILDMVDATQATPSNSHHLPASRGNAESLVHGMPIIREPLAAVFRISASEMLLGDDSELSASIDEGTTNRIWKVEPAVTMLMEEVEAIDAILSEPGPWEPAERSRRARDTDRRNRLKAVVEPRLKEGIRLMTYYQRCLFPHGTFRRDQRKWLIRAMRIFATRGFSHVPYAGSGSLEGWKPRLHEERNYVVRFGVERATLSKWLSKNGLEHELELSSDNPYVSELPLAAIARYFVPEVVLYAIDLLSHGGIEQDSNELEWLLSLRGWRFGPM